MRLTRHSIASVCACLLGAYSSQAQRTSQTITLKAGWNAVFLEVHPEPRESDLVFAKIPVESVWMWNRRSSSVQFVQDPNTLVPENPDWLVYLPPNNPISSKSTLFTIEGGQCYLIKLTNSAPQTSWLVQGPPSLRRIEWIPDSFNFAGFSVGQSPPTFASFFQSSAAHAGQPAYRLGASGTWELVGAPATTPMRSAEAFWIQTKGASSFVGPLEVTLPLSTGVEFGRSLVESQIRIKNNGSTAKTFKLAKLPSASAPTGVAPSAGDIVLNYWLFDPANNRAGWTRLDTPIFSPLLNPGSDWLVRLEVRRTELAAPRAGSDGLYTALLEISDESNSARVTLPVSSRGTQETLQGAALHFSAVNSPNPKAGLWVGSAVIDKVSQPASTSPDAPKPAAGEFQFRLLVHVDASGSARLLQKALLMWKAGTTHRDDQGHEVVDTPGRFVVVTEDKLIPNFTGAALRDSDSVARRFSSAAFGVRTNVMMAGNFGFGGNPLRCDVSLDYDDPLNPFKHKYHPDHNNLDEDFRTKLDRKRGESWDVTRTIQLQFTEKDPHNLALAGWGDTQVGGVYSETIVGLHKQALKVEGTFRLQLATRVPVLNDGL